MPVVLPPAGSVAVLVLLERLDFPAAVARVDHQMSPGARAAVAEWLRELRLVASWQQEWETNGAASVGGSAEELSAEAAGSSLQEMSTEEVAMKLDITTSRVRQLCRGGELKARQVAGSWLIDPASVALRATGEAA